MEFPFTNCLQFFFQTDWDFIRLPCHILSADVQRNQSFESLIKNRMPSGKKLLEKIKVYYCFNSKGDDFNVNQL